MQNLFQKYPRKTRIIGVFALLVIVGYAFFSYTSSGRITSMYIVGGWQAPWSVRTECRHTSEARVEELFAKPLMMDESAKNGLREYWHYSYYRECLYKAGYSFLGDVLPDSTLYALRGTEHWYVNTLAGVYLRVPAESSIVKDNELDVTFDAQLLRSELALPDGPVYLDTYLSHQFVKIFGDLPPYLEHFVASTSTITHTELATTTSGISYIEVTQDSGLCGAMTVSPDEHIIHLFAPCARYTRITELMNTLRLIPSVSVY